MHAQNNRKSLVGFQLETAYLILGDVAEDIIKGDEIDPVYNLGLETANMIASVLLDGKNPAELPVMTFDNGTATINTETAAAIGLDYDKLVETLAPFCTKVQGIQTAEYFQ